MKLSIVIPTRDRADWLLETIANISPQLRDGVELVIVDASKTFPNPQVTPQLTPFIRYERGTAISFDTAYDEAVNATRGEWVWLFSDDDWLKPTAITTVLENLDEKLGLVIVNSEVCDRALKRVLKPKWLDFPNRDYTTGEFDRTFADLADLGSFVGCLIVRRQLWLNRMKDCQRYLGTRFITFVIPFLKPTATRYVNDVLVSARFGHQNWVATIPQLIGVTMAEVVWSLPVADWAKEIVRPKHPKLLELLLWRALGCDVSQHSQLMVHFPKFVARLIIKLGLVLTGRGGGVSDYMLEITAATIPKVI